MTYIFAQVVSRNQEKILEHLDKNGATRLYEFREDVFKRNLSIDTIQRELSDLVDKGRIVADVLDDGQRVYALASPRVKNVG